MLLLFLHLVESLGEEKIINLPSNPKFTVFPLGFILAVGKFEYQDDELTDKLNIVQLERTHRSDVFGGAVRLVVDSERFDNKLHQHSTVCGVKLDVPISQCALCRQDNLKGNCDYIVCQPYF